MPTDKPQEPAAPAAQPQAQPQAAAPPSGDQFAKQVFDYLSSQPNVKVGDFETFKSKHLGSAARKGQVFKAVRNAQGRSQPPFGLLQNFSQFDGMLSGKPKTVPLQPTVDTLATQNTTTEISPTGEELDVSQVRAIPTINQPVLLEPSLDADNTRTDQPILADPAFQEPLPIPELGTAFANSIDAAIPDAEVIKPAKLNIEEALKSRLDPENDGKLIEDWMELVSKGISPFDMGLVPSREQMALDLSYVSPDYSSDGDLPFQFQLITEEEFLEIKENDPKRFRRLQLEAIREVNTTILSSRKRDIRESVRKSTEDISDQEMVLFNEDELNNLKSQVLLDKTVAAIELGEKGTRRLDQKRRWAREELFLLQSKAIDRLGDNTTSFKADTQRIISSMEADVDITEEDFSEVMEAARVQVADERLDFGVDRLSKDQRKTYELVAERGDIALKMSDPSLSASQREQLRSKIIDLKQKISARSGITAQLYDPETGQYIDQTFEDPEALQRAQQYEERVQRETAKLPSTDLDMLIRSWDRHLTRLKYLESELPNKFVVTVPGEERKFSINDILELNKQSGVPLSGDAARKVNQYFDMIQDTRSKFDAVNRALLLNEDPASIDKGFTNLMFEHGVESFSKEFFKQPLDIKTDVDFVENFATAIRETGGRLTKAQENAAKDELSDQIAKSIGDSVGPAASLILTSYVTAGVGNAIGVARFGAAMQGFMVGRYGNTGRYIYNITKNQLQGAAAFGLSGSDQLTVAMGVGEGTVQGILTNLSLEKFLKKGKWGRLLGAVKVGSKSFKPQEFIIRSATGGAVGIPEEFVGDYLDQLTKNGFDHEQAFKDVFGRSPKDFGDRLITIGITSVAFSSAFNTKTFLLAQEEAKGLPPGPRREEVLREFDKMAREGGIDENRIREAFGEQLPAEIRITPEGGEEVVGPAPTLAEVTEEDLSALVDKGFTQDQLNASDDITLRQVIDNDIQPSEVVIRPDGDIAIPETVAKAKGIEAQRVTRAAEEQVSLDVVNTLAERGFASEDITSTRAITANKIERQNLTPEDVTVTREGGLAITQGTNQIKGVEIEFNAQPTHEVNYEPENADLAKQFAVDYVENGIINGTGVAADFRLGFSEQQIKKISENLQANLADPTVELEEDSQKALDILTQGYKDGKIPVSEGKIRLGPVVEPIGVSFDEIAEGKEALSEVETERALQIRDENLDIIAAASLSIKTFNTVETGLEGIFTVQELSQIKKDINEREQRQREIGIVPEAEIPPTQAAGQRGTIEFTEAARIAAAEGGPAAPEAGVTEVEPTVTAEPEPLPTEVENDVSVVDAIDATPEQVIAERGDGNFTEESGTGQIHEISPNGTSTTKQINISDPVEGHTHEIDDEANVLPGGVDDHTHELSDEVKAQVLQQQAAPEVVKEPAKPKKKAPTTFTKRIRPLTEAAALTEEEVKRVAKFEKLIKQRSTTEVPTTTIDGAELSFTEFLNEVFPKNDPAVRAGRLKLRNELAKAHAEAVKEFEQTVGKQRAAVLKGLDSKINDIEQSIGLTEATPDVINQQAEADAKAIVAQSIIPVKQLILKPFQQGFAALNRAQEFLADKWINRIENAVAEQMKRSLASRSRVSRATASFLTAWTNGLPRTQNDLLAKNNLTGRIDLANENMAESMERLRKVVDNNGDQLTRVHAILDPDLYTAQQITDLGFDKLSIDELTDSEKELHGTLLAMNQYIHDYNFSMGLIDQDTYDKHNGKYIARAYEAIEIPKEAADFMAEGNLSFNTQVGKKTGKTVRKLTTEIFKARKEIDEFKQENKISDPVYLTTKRMMQTQVNAAILGYIENIQTQSPELVLTEDQAIDRLAIDPITRKLGIPGFKKLSGRAYGSLNGKWVANHIAEDFTGFFFGNTIVDLAYDMFKVYDRTQIRQFLKKYHTVFSPTVQLGNATSNFVFAFLSGIDPVTFGENVPEAVRQLNRKGGVYKFLIQNGILKTDLITKDLLPFDKDMLDQLTTDIKDVNVIKRNFKKYKGLLGGLVTNKGVLTSSANLLQNANKDLIELYQSSDDVAKISAYLSLKQQGFSDQKALEIVARGFQNYSTVGKIWDLASKTPIVGNPFVKFQADLQRILKNAVLKRPISTAMFIGLLQAIAVMASKWSDEDEELKQLRESRKFIPKVKLPDFVGGDAPLVFKFGESEINLARYLSPYYIYDRGDMEHPIENWGKFLPYQLEVIQGAKKGQQQTIFKRSDVLAGVWWSAILDDRDFRGKSIRDPEASRFKDSKLTDHERMLNVMNYIARSQFPYWSNAQDMYLSNTYGTDFYNRDRNGAQSVLNNFIKIQQFDSDDYLEIAQREISQREHMLTNIETALKQLDTEINKEISDANTKVLDKKITQDQFNNVVSDLEDKRLKRKLALMIELADATDEYSAKNMELKNILGPNVLINQGSIRGGTGRSFTGRSGGGRK